VGRLGERFRALRERGETALVTFVTAGDPDLETTEALVLSMAEAGADVIEIGVPFSDPIGEGPTIQRASERALASGTSLRKVLDLVRRLRPRVEIPLVLMGYANNLLAMGERRFAEAASAVGVDGIIVVDLPPEEGERFFDEVRAAGIDPILLAAPTTVRARLEKLAKETRGFLYYVSVTGVTGARAELPATLEGEVAAARAVAEVPVCVGFGVSTPEQARRVGEFADGVVVGSALVERIARAASRDEAVDAVGSLVAALKEPLRRA
jgi:tryptophan synthase alpha chain